MDYLKVGEGKVARISEWLQLTGDGYRMITLRLKEKRKERPKKDSDIPKEGLAALERKFPTRFWPKILIEGLLKYSKVKKKEEILESLEGLKLKPDLYKQIEKEFRKLR